AGSRTGASDMKNTPFLNCSTNSAARRNASRVFPVPPAPVRVRRRTSARLRSAPRSSISRCRPTNVDASAGRLVLLRLRSGGHRVARPRKCDEERVALGVNLDPAVLGHGAAQGAAVGGEDLGIALTQVVNEPRRSLDVGE